MPTYHIKNGDCRIELSLIEECSIDSVVCDPPYELGFMGKAWDRSGIAYQVEVWRECLRVLKPGGHLLAFGGSRTYHRLACAIEDAGFEIRDDIDFWYDANPIFAEFYNSLTDEQQSLLHASAGAPHLSWVYGSGFPKSLDVSKAIDAAAGAEREIVGDYGWPDGKPRNTQAHQTNRNGIYSDIKTGGLNDRTITAPATDTAKQWNGWGTALKPAHEPIVLARKPLIGTVAENVLQHGTGGLNIDGCRVEGIAGDGWWGQHHRLESRSTFGASTPDESWERNQLGRWPANVIHDGSDEVLAGFPESDHARGNQTPTKREQSNGVWTHNGSRFGVGPDGRTDPGDSGSAARFFYCAKASKEDRENGLESLPIRTAGEVTDRQDGSDGLNSPRAGAGRTNGSRNHHPTVKPTDLMRYLCRLVTPPNGTVLDPFCGSGSTGRGAILEGLNFIGIEIDAEYCELAGKRIEAVTRQGMLMFA